LNPTSNEKQLFTIIQLLYSIKKASSIYFFFTIRKKFKREEKNFKRKKHKIENILKGKKN
jgi:hypothetical protein